MKALLLVWVYCNICALGRSEEKTAEPYEYKVRKSIEIQTDKQSQLEQLLPNNLLESLFSEQKANDLRARILNNAQIVQHPQGAQSFYLPPDLNTSTAEHVEVAKEPVQLQVPISSDDKHIYLKLSSDSQQQTHSSPYPYRAAPRKHYKIVLVRSPPKPTAPPQPQLPEVEEKTLIYVLVKKPDQPTQAQLQETQQAHQNAFKLNKPEVYFINYKTSLDNQQKSAGIEANSVNNEGPIANNSHTNTTAAEQQNPSAAANQANNLNPKQTAAIEEIIRRQVLGGNNNDNGYLSKSKL